MNFSLFFFLFFCSATLSGNQSGDQNNSPINSKSSQKQTQQDLANIMCGPNIIRYFLEDNAELINPIPASKEINDICPSLNISCCSAEALNQAANEFLKAFHSMEKTRVLAEGVYQWLEVVDLDSLMQIVQKLNPKSENEKSEDYSAALDEFKTAFKTAVSKRKDILKDLNQAQQNIREYYAGFICEYCHPRVINAMNLPKSLDNSSYSIGFSLNASSYKKSFDLMVQSFDFWKQHIDLAKILVTLNANEAEINQFIIFLAEKKFRQFDEFAANCSKPKSFSQEECIRAVFESNHPLNSFSTFSNIVNEIYQKTYDQLVKRLLLNPKVVVPDQLDNNIEFYKFKGSSMSGVKVFDVHFQETRGFDMTINKLNEKFWKSANLLFRGLLMCIFAFLSW